MATSLELDTSTVNDWRNDDPREVYHNDQLVGIVIMDGPGSVWAAEVNTMSEVYTGNIDRWDVRADTTSLAPSLTADDTWPDWWWWVPEQKLW